MKKLSSIIVVAMFAVLTFSSCKKDYTCNCTLHDTLTGTNTTAATTIKDKKDAAKSSCESGNYTDTSSFPGDTITFTCAIQ